MYLMKLFAVASPHSRCKVAGKQQYFKRLHLIRWGGIAYPKLLRNGFARFSLQLIPTALSFDPSSLSSRLT
jgi:hypothetical protein